MLCVLRLNRLEAYRSSKKSDYSKQMTNEENTSWSYVILRGGQIRPFVSKMYDCKVSTYVYKVPSKTSTGATTMIPTGLVFVHGSEVKLKEVLSKTFSTVKLAQNHNDKSIATIPDWKMQPVMEAATQTPDRIFFLNRSMQFYAKDHHYVRLLSGSFKGFEGYYFRIHHDHKLVTDLGGLALAIGGVHNEEREILSQ